MPSEGFKKIGIAVLGIGVILGSTAISIWKTNSVERKLVSAEKKIARANERLKTANAIIKQMRSEHASAIQLANTALKERMEIYENARERICEAEKRIGGNTDFCNQLMPDDIVRLWKEQDRDRDAISKNPVSAPR